MMDRVHGVGSAVHSPQPTREARMRRAPLSLLTALLLAATPALAQGPAPAGKAAPAAKRAGALTPVASVEGITE
jgi:hypothetical protein